MSCVELLQVEMELMHSLFVVLCSMPHGGIQHLLLISDTGDLPLARVDWLVGYFVVCFMCILVAVSYNVTIYFG